jgi:DHA2 family multidrug resistance protein-like MFS transporter
MAPVFTLTTDLVVGSAPPEKAGAASAISETSAEFGGALGIAVFGSIGVALYRTGLTDAIPASVGADTAEAARATLAGAMDVARELPGRAGPELAQTAKSAFIRGLQLCAAISTVGSLLLAVFAAIALRHHRGGAEAAPAPEAQAAPPAAASQSA